MDVPGTELMTKDVNVPIDIPDTYEVKGSTDGATQESLAAAFEDLIKAQLDESAADPTAPSRKPPRSDVTAETEAIMHGGDGSSQHERVTPEADMLAKGDSSEFTDGYLPTSEARKSKLSTADLIGDFTILASFDTLVGLARSYFNAHPDTTPQAWTGTQKVAGHRDIGWVANAGNCGVEAVAVAFHRSLIAERSAGVARYRDSIPAGANSVGSVDADMHFDPGVNSYGDDHPGRPFLQATRHIRRKSAAYVVRDGWWGANKASAIAYCGKPNAPPPTLDTVVEALTTDREWTGEFELQIIAEAFGFALVVYDCDGSKFDQRGACPLYGNPTGRLIEIVYHSPKSHCYCICGPGDDGYAGAAAMVTSSSEQTTVTSTASNDGDSSEDDDVCGLSQAEQLEQELVSLMSESLAWDKVDGAEGYPPRYAH